MPGVDGDTVLGQVVAEQPAHLGLLGGDDPGTALDDVDGGPDPGVGLAQLDPDRASTEDHQRCRQGPGQRGLPVGPEGDVGQARDRRHEGIGPGGDHDAPAGG